MNLKKEIAFYDKFKNFIGNTDISEEFSFLLGIYFLRDLKIVNNNVLEFLYDSVPASRIVDVELACYHTFGGSVKNFIYGEEKKDGR